MLPDNRPAFPPVLVLAIGVLFAATSSILIRFAQENAGSLAIAAWRMSLAVLVLTPFALTRQRAELSGLRRAILVPAVLSGFFLALHFATWISSLAYTSVASSVVLVDTAPLWVALFAPLLLHETIGRPVKIGMILAVIGGIVVGISDICTLAPAGLVCPPLEDLWRGKALWGDLLALAGAVAAALYLILGRKVRAHISLLSYILVVYSSAAVVLVFFLIVSGQPAVGFPPETFLWLLALAIFPQLLGHSSYNWALGYLPAAYVSITLLAEPIGSTLLAVITLGEVPSAFKVAGGVLILVGILVASRKTS